MTKRRGCVDKRTTREVLHITTWYPSRAEDPTGTFVREHIRAVAPFASCSVLHITWADTLEARRYALTEVVAPGDASVLRLAIGRGATRPFWLLIGVAHALAREVATRGRPRLLHTHTTPATALGVVLGFLLLRPFVATEHWTGLLAGGEGHRLHRRLLTQMAFRRAALVMPVGPSLADGIRPLTGRTPIEVVANVVDESIFNPAEESGTRADRLLAIASLIPRKRVDLVIRAVAVARRARPELSLVVIGDGPERHRLEDLASSLEVDRAVTFRGALAKSDVAAEIRRADVVVIASERETFSVVAAEAMCCGVPVVSTRCGGPEHLLDQQSGVVLDDADETSLAEALLSAVARTWDHTAISHTAHSRFSAAAIGRQIDSVYDRAAPRGPRCTENASRTDSADDHPRPVVGRKEASAVIEDPHTR